jgi:hypothetical protein
MNIHQMIVFSLGTLALAGNVLASELSDTDRRFRLTAPDGWTTQPSPGEPIALVIASPRAMETRGNCNVFAAKNELAGKSQAEVDKYANDMVNNEAFWKAALGSVPIFKSTTIDKYGARDADGRKVFFVKATSRAESGGTSLMVTQVQDMHPTPGMTFAVTCTSLTDKFASEETDFASIMTSFKPSMGLMVGWAPRPVNYNAVRNDAGRAAHIGITAGTLRTMGRR